MTHKEQLTHSTYLCSLNKKVRELTTEEHKKYRTLYADSRREHMHNQNKIWKESRKEHLTAYHKQYAIDNKECIDAYREQYYNDNKERIDAYREQYYNDNKEQIIVNRKQYYIDNKERFDAYNKQYRIDNKEYNAAYIKQYNKTSEAHKLRCWLNAAVKRQGGKKTTWFKHVGCTKEEFIEHIKEQFVEGMTWDNRGRSTWHLDHIIPLSKGGTNHYTNIQPLWAKDNLAKGNRTVPVMSGKALHINHP